MVDIIMSIHVMMMRSWQQECAVKLLRRFCGECRRMRTRLRSSEFSGGKENLEKEMQTKLATLLFVISQTEELQKRKITVHPSII
jgi:hypothetical protein